MDQTDQLDELLTCRLEFGRKKVEPCSIVIFGASGDLTARKLIPARARPDPRKLADPAIPLKDC